MSEVSLDWDDIRYVKLLERPVRATFEGLLRDRLSGWGKTAHVAFRRSSGGRVHVRIRTTTRLSELDRLCFRLILDDDRTRLKMDAFRHLRGDQMNRLWDFKVSGGKVGRAGNWRYWFTIRAGARSSPRRRPRTHRRARRPAA